MASILVALWGVPGGLWGAASAAAAESDRHRLLGQPGSFCFQGISSSNFLYEFREVVDVGSTQRDAIRVKKTTYKINKYNKLLNVLCMDVIFWYKRTLMSFLSP